MCQKETWGAIVAPKEAHSTQRGQPSRMHGPGLWKYEQKEVTNDYAERGVALIQEAAQSRRFENEEQLQYALQVIEQIRAEFPDAKKSTLRRKLSLDQTNNSFKTDTTN